MTAMHPDRRIESTIHIVRTLLVYPLRFCLHDHSLLLYRQRQGAQPCGLYARRMPRTLAVAMPLASQRMKLAAKNKISPERNAI